MEGYQHCLGEGCIQDGVGILSRAGSWVANCSWQAGRPGRYSFGEGRLLEGTAGLPEMDGLAAGHPGSLQLGQGQGLELGRREERSSETAAAAVGAEEDRAGGLRAECCILRGERGRKEGFWIFFPKKCEQQFILQHSSILAPSRITLTRVLHTILLLRRSAWLLRRVSTRSLVLLVHLTYKRTNTH